MPQTNGTSSDDFDLEKRRWLILCLDCEVEYAVRRRFANFAAVGSLNL